MRSADGMLRVDVFDDQPRRSLWQRRPPWWAGPLCFASAVDTRRSASQVPNWCRIPKVAAHRPASSLVVDVNCGFDKVAEQRGGAWRHHELRFDREEAIADPDQDYLVSDFITIDER
jgi:hypothetical protein